MMYKYGSIEDLDFLNPFSFYISITNLEANYTFRVSVIMHKRETEV